MKSPGFKILELKKDFLKDIKELLIWRGHDNGAMALL